MASSLDLFRKKISVLAKAISDYKAETPVDDPNANEIFDYKAGKAKHMKTTVERCIVDLKKGVWDLADLRKADPTNQILLLDILNKVTDIKQTDAFPAVEKKLGQVSFLVSRLVPGENGNAPASQLSFEMPKLPDEVMDDLMADINEIRKCFDAGCYRSSVIICGRVLETALNRKYFEVSGNDLLETSPGLGLGKIIAKLEEKGVHLDPGLTQQIHMVNQVRIYSVHKKKEAFYPSKGQTQAMVLYTVDVLRKLFSE